MEKLGTLTSLSKVDRLNHWYYLMSIQYKFNCRSNQRKRRKLQRK